MGKELTERLSPNAQELIKNAMEFSETKVVVDPATQARNEFIDSEIASKKDRSVDDEFAEISKENPELFGDEFTTSVLTALRESFKDHPQSLRIRELSAVAQATKSVISQFVEKARIQGQTEVADKIAQKPKGTRVVTGATKKSAQPPKKSASQMTEAEVNAAVGEAMFSEK